MPHHCALIGDIKQSRKLDNWPQVYRTLTRTLDEVNRRFADDVLIEFKPTVGDEFQGALKKPDRAYQVYTFIKASLPVAVYCGMGIGEVEKPLQEDVGLRGTAFYRAREALERCKRQQGILRIKSSDESGRFEDTVNTMLLLIETMENSWTRRQTEVAHYYRLHPDYTYEKIGEHFGASKQFVYKILKATHFQVILEAEGQISDWLKEHAQ